MQQLWNVSVAGRDYNPICPAHVAKSFHIKIPLCFMPFELLQEWCEYRDDKNVEKGESGEGLRTIGPKCELRS